MTKKNIYLTLLSLIIVGAGAYGIYALQPQKKENDTTTVSNNKSITLANSSALKNISDGMELAGTYHITKDQALFYTITSKDELVSSGSILPDNKGKFSRNIVFTKKDLAKDTKLDLKIYTQSNTGKITDSLALTSKYQKK